MRQGRGAEGGEEGEGKEAEGKEEEHTSIFQSFLHASAELGVVICMFPFNSYKRFGN